MRVQVIKALMAVSFMIVVLVSCVQEEDIATVRADFSVTIVGESPNSKVIITNNSVGATSYQWTIGDDPVLLKSTNETPEPIGIDKIGDLKIELIAKNGTEESEMTTSVEVSGDQPYNILLDSRIKIDDPTYNNAPYIKEALAAHDVIYFPAGVYYTNALRNSLRSNQVIYGDGKNLSVIKRKDEIGEYLVEQISFGGVSNSVHDVTFRDIGIHGISGHQEALVKFRDSYNLTFDRVSFRYAEGMEFVDKNAQNKVSFPKKALLRFDAFSNNTVNDYTNYIINCDFEDFFYGIWDRVEGYNEGGHLVVRDCYFESDKDNSDMEYEHASAAINIGADAFGKLSDYRIYNNEFADVDDTGVMIVGSNVRKSDIQVFGNTIFSHQVGVWIESSDINPTSNVSIVDNEVVSTIDVGIQAHKTEDFIIARNHVHDGGFSGIVLFDSRDGVIAENHVFRNGNSHKRIINDVIVNYNDGISVSSREGKGCTNILIKNNFSEDNGLKTGSLDNPANAYMGAQITVAAFSDEIQVIGNILNGDLNSQGFPVPKELIQPNDRIELNNLMNVTSPTTRHLNSTFSGNLPKSLRVNANYEWHDLDLNFSTIKEYDIKNYYPFYTINSLDGALPGDVVTIKYKNVASSQPFGITWPDNGTIKWKNGEPDNPGPGEEIIVMFTYKISSLGDWVYEEI